MEYRSSVPTRVRGSALPVRTLRELFSCPSRTCCCWASNFYAWPCGHLKIWINFSFKVKEQFFEQTFCHLIFPVQCKASWLSKRCGKVRVQSQHRRSSSPVAVPVEANCRAHSGHTLSVHKEWQPDVAGRIGKKMALNVSDSFVFIRERGFQPSTDEGKNKKRPSVNVTRDDNSTHAFACFVSLSLSLSLSLSDLSLSLTHSLTLSLSLSLSLPLSLETYTSFSNSLLDLFQLRQR